jgi:type IV secretory pathway TraG/TraD family ATPase VirD4
MPPHAPIGPRPGLLPPEAVPGFVVLAMVAGTFAVAWLAWASAAAAAAAFTGRWAPPPFSTAAAAAAASTGPGALFGVPDAVVVGAWVLTATAVVAATTLAARRTAGPRSDDPVRALARPADVAALTPGPVTQRARALRPSLPRAGRLDPADTGYALGSMEPSGPVLRASVEDVLLAIMAPRAGKTTALAVPMVLAAPGPVVATSNKADLLAATAGPRRAAGPCWVFDPQGIAHSPRAMSWDPLAGVTTVAAAHRLAGHFTQEVRDASRGGSDFWVSAAGDLLTALLLAAGLAGRSLSQVYEWLNDSGAKQPVQLLRRYGMDAVAAGLEGRQAGAVETREGIYETARTAAQSLRDPEIIAWVTPDAGLPVFEPAAFVGSTGTLYAMSKDGGGSAAPLVAALVDAVLRAGTRHAEARAGRLDPPMLVMLDEAANVAKIADLPALFSHLGSRSINACCVLQSYRQGSSVWGDAGMDTLWSAATVKVIGAGIDDAKMAEDISRLVGEHDVTVRSTSHGRQSSHSLALRRQRILPPEAVRALPRGRALVLATGAKPAMVRLLPWYDAPGAVAVRSAMDQQEAAIRGRAAAAMGLDRQQGPDGHGHEKEEQG